MDRRALQTVRDVSVTPIAFADPPLLNAAGVHQPWALRAIVQVRTGEGLVGLGETYGDTINLALLREAAHDAVGLSIFDLPGLRRRLDTELGTTPSQDTTTTTAPSRRMLAQVYAALECALLDLQGQVTEQPVHALLGGAVRAAVPFCGYLFYKWASHPGAEPDNWGAALDPDGIVAQAKSMVRRYGFRSLKLKGGVFPPEEEMAAIQALRHAFPHTPLRLDPNAAWTVDTSHRVAEDLGGMVEYLEDPTPGRTAMAEVAACSPLPLATNMCVTSFDELPEAVRLGSVQIVLADHHYWGGLRACVELAAVCRTFDIGVSMHSNSHLGISLAAMVHLAAATDNLTYACDTHTPWADDDVVAQPLPIVDGAVAVPDTPGLGVRLDPDALEQLHRQYQSCGIRDRADTLYMRRFRPDFAPPQGTW